jgi:YD repeat-containing protein
MTAIRFHLNSSLTPEAAMQVLTDFSPARAEAWPTIDAEHFTVHAQGYTWAEVTEGTAAAWERARYEWDDERKRVEITTLDSKVFGPGGGWVFQITPEDAGSRIDVELTRQPRTLQRKLLAALLPLVGPASLSKSFAGPLQAR